MAFTCRYQTACARACLHPLQNLLLRTLVQVSGASRRAPSPQPTAPPSSPVPRTSSITPTRPTPTRPWYTRTSTTTSRGPLHRRRPSRSLLLSTSLRRRRNSLSRASAIWMVTKRQCGLPCSRITAAAAASRPIQQPGTCCRRGHEGNSPINRGRRGRVQAVLLAVEVPRLVSSPYPPPPHTSQSRGRHSQSSQSPARHKPLR